MQITSIVAASQKEWNTFVSQTPDFALLQSWEWGIFKENLGWLPFRVAVKQNGNIVAGAQMLIKQLPLKVASIAYIPHGPLGAWLDEKVTSQFLGALHDIARQYKTIFLKIEPPLTYHPQQKACLQKYRFQPSIYNNQPQATILIDLKPPLVDILGQMRKKNRQYIRQAEQKGVTVRYGSIEDINLLYELIQLTAQRSDFSSRSFDYYYHQWQTFAKTNQTVLLMAYQEDRLLAVRTVYRCGRHAAEFHAGSVEGETNLRANYLLVWEAIKWARSQGCETYDLWGIPDEVGQTVAEGHPPPTSTQHHGLWGVYHFKRGFSKNIVYRLGAYDYIYTPFWYKLINNQIVNVNTFDRMATWMDMLR